MGSKVGKWILGLAYIVAVASIWIAASFVVQSVIDGGVSPFLITYICNSLFIIYIPLVEISRYLEQFTFPFFNRTPTSANPPPISHAEQRVLLDDDETNPESPPKQQLTPHDLEITSANHPAEQIDRKGRWTRKRTAKVSLLICPFWFMAQLTFNLSLKYTTVTSNTILSSSSSLLTFLASLFFLNDKFTWVKLASVILCMAGTIIVSLGDSTPSLRAAASNPLLGDALAILSSSLYAVYITLIRVKLPEEEEEGQGRVSMAQFLGFLGLFNMLIFLPVALILDVTKVESFDVLTGKQLGLVIGKGLLDNVVSDYLWARAVVLTTTTVATAGLTIQVPLAAVVDSIIGNAPSVMDIVGGVAVLFGFFGINLPSGNDLTVR